MRVAHDGHVLAHDVMGKLDVKCFISCVHSEIKVQMNRRFQDLWASSEKSVKLFKNVKVNDENVISLIPPDGSFELLNYTFQGVTMMKAPHFLIGISFENISSQPLFKNNGRGENQLNTKF